MIKVLKEDFLYHKWVFIILYGIGFLIIFLDCIGNSMDIDILMGTTTMAYLISLWILAATEDGEKRERFQSQLPLSIKEFGFYRLIFVVLIQMGIVMLWLLHMFLKYTDDWPRLLLNMFANNGYNLLIILLFAIFGDLGCFGKRAYQAIFLFIVLLLIAGLVLLHLNKIIIFPMSYSATTSRTIFEGIIYTSLAATALYTDYLIFIRRKTYLK